MWYLFQSEAKTKQQKQPKVWPNLSILARANVCEVRSDFGQNWVSAPHNCGQSESGPVAGGAIGPWWETRLNVVVRYQPGINQVYVSSVQPSVHQVYNQVSTLWKVKTSPHSQVLAVMTSCNFWDYRVIKIYIDMSSNLILSVNEILCSNPHHLWTEKAQSTNSTGV